MASTSYVEFEPSHRVAPPGKSKGVVPKDEPIEISIYLKPQTAPKKSTTRAAMAKARAGTQKDGIKLVTDFAKQAGLHVVSAEPARRLVKLSGPAGRMQAAFKTKLKRYEDGKGGFRGRQGTLSMPGDMAEVVEAVLGLDTRPAATPRLVRRAATAASSFLPNAVAKLYNYPTDVTGAGQCIGLIELGGGYNAADVTAAFKAMKLTPPKVTAVSVDGGSNKPKPDDGADGEVALDIQVAGGAAHGAAIAVYFSPNTDAGFVDAVTQAAHDATHKPGVISISWGGPESSWTAQGRAAMSSALQDAASLGISVFVAAGDNLATDGVKDGKAHVDFPASSPWAIGCGGTNITAAGGKITAERVWNNGDSGTGGGISAAYAVPAFQTAANKLKNVSTGKPGRGVPDVAGNGDPESGYVIVVGGKKEVVGGTSAVAPLWAGLAALINEKAAKPIGFFLPAIYKSPKLLNDVTNGNNQPTGSHTGYAAGPGWDACTGLGSPNGLAVFEALTK